MPGPAGDILIRPIAPRDVDAFRDMRVEALRLHPVAFTADLGEAEARPLEAWRELVARSGGDGAEVVMVAEAAGGRLAGMAGAYTEKQPKLAHAGTVWGVYVRKDYRGRGLCQALVRGCIDWARGRGLVMLRLSATGDEAAIRCYERCGFGRYGVEPLAVRWEGKFYDEVLLALRL